jgi:hypothetical protein
LINKKGSLSANCLPNNFKFQILRKNKKPKKCIPSVQKRFDAILASGQIPIVFGNRVVVKYSDEYFELRKRNERAVLNSRMKKMDEKRVLERIREVIKVIKIKIGQENNMKNIEKTKM